MRPATLLRALLVLALVLMIIHARSAPSTHSGKPFAAAQLKAFSLPPIPETGKLLPLPTLPIPMTEKPPPPPTPPIPVTVPPPPTALPVRVAGKPCPTGCETHGTCNRQTGECQCLPMMGGKSCDLNLVPSCRRLWSIELPIPPCQALATELEEWKNFPASCECLAECHALNHRIVYADKCVNTTQTRLHPQGDRSAQYPWVDPHGDGRWMRQAYTPDRKAAPLSEQELTRLNLVLAEKLTAHGDETIKMGLCSGRGLHTEAMPWWPSQARSERHCHCVPGWFGAQCEHGPGSPMSPQAKRYCVKDCSGRGVCKLNFCHCVPGTWGIDCGLGEVDRSAVLVATQEHHQLLRHRPGTPSQPEGWTEAMLSAPSPLHTPKSEGALRIFVYDLPPRFNVWLTAHFRREGRWDQSYLYSLDAKIHRWLLRSPYRTLDPELADFFFMPAYLSQA